MRRAYVASPYRCQPSAVELALRGCRRALDSGRAPLAPHLYLPDVLDDRVEGERILGLAAGLAWIEAADEVWAWGWQGVEGWTSSEGVRGEIARAEAIGVPVRRYVGSYWDAVV